MLKMFKKRDGGQKFVDVLGQLGEQVAQGAAERNGQARGQRHHAAPGAQHQAGVFRLGQVHGGQQHADREQAAGKADEGCAALEHQWRLQRGRKDHAGEGWQAEQGPKCRQADGVEPA